MQQTQTDSHQIYVFQHGNSIKLDARDAFHNSLLGDLALFAAVARMVSRL